MTATLIILAVSAILFVLGPIRSDLVAVCAAIALVLAGVLTPEEALSGFSNPIVIMMVGLFVVGGGIFSTGLAKMMGSRILSLAGTSETRLFVLLMLTTGGVGAFVSNTGTVALMLPIVVSMARAAGLQSSRFLMPLAFAGSMGGMLTLIGTPPNLVIRDALIHAGYGENVLSFFSFTPVGIVCLIVGILVLLPLSRRFLSKDTGENVKGKGKTLQQLAEEYQLDERLTTLKVTANSPVIGKTAKALNLHDTYGVTIVEIRREGGQKTPLLKRVEQYASADTEFADGDTILLSGPEDQVKLFAAENALLRCKKQKQSKNLAFYSVGIAEILLMSTSEMVGKTIRELDFRARYGVNVLGVRRHSDYLLRNIGDIRLHASDVILVQGPWETISGLSRQSNSWVVLGEPLEAARRVTLDYKAPLAAVIMLLMVLAMAIDAIPIAPVTAVMIAAVLMVLTGCLRNVEEAYKTINWDSIVLFGAMLPMSIALDKTGTSALISHSLVTTFGGYGPYVLLAAIYVATSLLTFFISNTVTAVLMAPIALAAATAGGYNGIPFLMAVTVAASMCFASPFSTPPNALVMSAGGYKPMDYVKVGLPLQFVMALVMIFVLPLFFPF